MAQQTAVEQLVNYMKENFHLTDESLEKFDEAKQMEREQIMNAFDIRKIDIAFDKKTTSEQYYNDTYGNNQTK